MKWADWLDARFVTYDVAKQGGLASAQASVQPVAVEAVKASTPAAQPARTVASPDWKPAGYVPRKLIINGQP